MNDIANAVLVFEDARASYSPGEAVVVRVGGEVLDKGRLVKHVLVFESAGDEVETFNGIVLSDILSGKERAHLLEDGVEFEFGNLQKRGD